MILEAMLIFGVAIIISVLGHILFEQTGIPESIFMILLGVFAGPMSGIISPSGLDPILPYMFRLSLLVILFESGIHTRVSEAFTAMKKSSLFTIIVLIASMLVCGGVLHLLLGWKLLHSMVLGIICSGTNVLPIIFLTSRMSIKEELRSFLIFESIFNDITLLGGMTILLKTMTLNLDIGATLGKLLKYITLPLLYGTIAAIIWAYAIIKYFAEIRLKYISSIAITIILYTLTEIDGGSGILAVMIFSIILGNIHQIVETSEIFSETIVDFLSQIHLQLESIRDTQQEISFLAKNLFFFVMGIMVNLEVMDTNVILISSLLIFLIFISRLFSSRLIAFLDSTYIRYILTISLMLPRGLTASIASFMPLEMGIQIPLLKEIVVVMVILTNLTATFGYLLVDRGIIKTNKKTNKTDVED